MTENQKEKMVAEINKAFPTNYEPYPLAFVVDGAVTVSCEQGCKALDDEMIGDYYYEGHDRDFGIHPKFKTWFDKKYPAFFCEWKNGGCFSIWER